MGSTRYLDPDWTRRLPQRGGMAYGLADGHSKFYKASDSFYSADPAYAGNKNGDQGSYLPEPFGPVAASAHARPSATVFFGPLSGQ